MATKNITTRMLDGKPKSIRDEVWDAVVPGFGYRKSIQGKAAFFVSYRDSANKKRRYSFGKYPALTLGEAREWGADLLKKAARGESLERVETIDTTFATLMEQYLTEYAEPRLRTAIQVRRALTRYALPLFGPRAVARITPTDIHNLIASIGAPFQANRTRSYLSGFFKWCCSQPPIPVTVNPVRLVDKPHAEKSRDRVLTREEVQAVLKAARGIGGPFGVLFEVLIRTGLRKGEVAKLTWDRLDLVEGVLVLGAEDTKNAQPITVPLTPTVSRLLQGVERKGPYVLTTNGKTPISGFSKAERRLKETVGIANIRVHDFRRTFASTLGQLKVEPHIIEACLNHTGGKITGIARVYNRYQYFDERREALLRLEGHLADNAITHNQEIAS
ncbi:MAG: tyrosine-type recombinase/integrase [Chromatiales bacterium]|jgi:integrase|nr:tyrosine-type recombinase/integrase [Chromatiales bacterium]